jgi:hypothetical protein
VSAASSGRISRRLLRKMLQGATCAACSGDVDEYAHRAFWFDERGRAHPHLICRRCWNVAAGDQASIDDLATRCALALCEPGGNA